MIDIPLSYVSYERAPNSGKWDMRFMDRVLAGQEGVPPGGYRFVHAPWTPEDHRGRVVVFPAGSYAQDGNVHRVRNLFVEDLRKLEWALVVATSDETQSFEWHKIDPWPDHVRLWVMLPKVDQEYPPGTRFIGEGSPMPGGQIQRDRAFTRDLDVFFSGQGGHERRDLAWQAISKLSDRALKVKAHRTSSFLRGMGDDEIVQQPGDDHEYVHSLTRSWIAPCPSGIASQSSFRLYEALEAGCIPIADGLAPKGNAGFWQMLDFGFAKVAPIIDDWAHLGPMCESLLVDRCGTAAHIGSRWLQYKRNLIADLHNDVLALGAPDRDLEPPHDLITVIIPTSPIPSNPDLSIIKATVQSVRQELPGAEILIAADGVRSEQSNLTDRYHVYLHELVQWANTQFNMWVFTHDEHLHQSGLMRSILPEVRTPFVLFVEHDTPLEGTVPFAEMLTEMELWQLNSMRLLHEVAIPPGSERLFLERKTGSGWHAPWVPTIQWSQRPHLARTDWYRDIIATYFGERSRTFIEDLMHGVVQARTGGADEQGFAVGLQRQEAWERWRMAVYAPEGSWKRSGHLDGRAGGSKFSVKFAYDGDKPEDAPAPGTYLA